MNCNTVLGSVYSILSCKNCVYLCIYHLFHILLSMWHTDQWNVCICM